MEDTKPGVFVEAKLLPESAAMLHDFVTKTLKISPAITIDHYHITLAYSKKWFQHVVSGTVNNSIVRPVAWEVFGQAEKVLVLRVDGDSVRNRNAELQKAGAVSDFPDYKPHITVAPVSPEFNPAGLVLPPFVIGISHERGEELDPTFTYNPKAMAESTLKTFKEFIRESKTLDHKTLSVAELAKKHGKSEDHIEARIKQGMKTEAEHSSDPKVQREIAMDHIGEKEDYYDRLKKVE